MQRICFRYFIDDDINGGTMNATTAVSTSDAPASPQPVPVGIGWS